MLSLPLQSAPVPVAPWYRHRWPWLLMIGPAWVLIAGVIIGTLAYSRPDAMVVDDYYSRGKAINQDLRRDKAATARAIVIDLVYARDAAGATVRGHIGADGKPLSGPLRLRLVHPTQPARDLELGLAADGGGDFTAALPALEATRWQLQAEGGSGAAAWRLAQDDYRPSLTPQVRLGGVAMAGE
jgi:hypothetical protein